MTEVNDHDNLVRLIESVNNFHNETRAILKDLKDNFQSTINNHEQRLVDLEKMKEECKKDIDTIKQMGQLRDDSSKTVNSLVIGVGSFVLLLVLGLLLWHITGYHI